VKHEWLATLFYGRSFLVQEIVSCSRLERGGS